MPRPKETKKVLPPSNDPKRPPKGAASGTLNRVHATCYRCCGNHAGCTSKENTDDR